MSKRRFTVGQLELLANNKFVSKCSEKSITYSTEFKVLAVTKYEQEGLAATQIFTEAGFDLDVIGRHVPDSQLYMWRKIQRIKGLEGLKITRGRGGRPRTVDDLSDAEKIERLEATVAYLKAENSFLAKLRAMRRE